MITPGEAEHLIRGVFADLPRPQSEDVPLHLAVGRRLAEDVDADRDQPPFDRVAMDGVGVVFSPDLEQVAFTLRARLAAWASKPDGKYVPGEPLEVVTGAALPPPYDTVVPWENLSSEGGRYRMRPGARFERGLNIHRRGSDYRKGERLLVSGTRLGTPHLHTLASVGKSAVHVIPRPRITLLATGDELVAVDAVPGPFQIRASNMPAIGGLLERAGLPALSMSHLPDDRARLRVGLMAAIAEHDVVILGGAVSKGSKNGAPGVAAELGCTPVFDGIAQKPGRPMWFGIGPRGTVVAALPGNPASSLICFRRYLLPALLEYGGRPRPRYHYVLPLANRVAQDTRYTLFGPATLVRAAGTTRVAVERPRGPARFASLGSSDGFVQIPPGPASLEENEPVAFFPWEVV